jgi:hypothetical protein
MGTPAGKQALALVAGHVGCRQQTGTSPSSTHDEPSKAGPTCTQVPPAHLAIQLAHGDGLGIQDVHLEQ